jgi:hypothetical protein
MAQDNGNGADTMQMKRQKFTSRLLLPRVQHGFTGILITQAVQVI